MTNVQLESFSANLIECADFFNRIDFDFYYSLSLSSSRTKQIFEKIWALPELRLAMSLQSWMLRQTF